MRILKEVGSFGIALAIAFTVFLGMSVVQGALTENSVLGWCSNNYDNDGDGLVDLADPDCTPSAFRESLAPAPGGQPPDVLTVSGSPFQKKSGALGALELFVGQRVDESNPSSPNVGYVNGGQYYDGVLDSRGIASSTHYHLETSVWDALGGQVNINIPGAFGWAFNFNFRSFQWGPRGECEILDDADPDESSRCPALYEDYVKYYRDVLGWASAPIPDWGTYFPRAARINNRILLDFCKDEDGCEVLLGIREKGGGWHAPAISQSPFRLFIAQSPASNWWQSSNWVSWNPSIGRGRDVNNVSETAALVRGYDSSNTVIVSECLLTDGEPQPWSSGGTGITGYVNPPAWDDREIGFELRHNRAENSLQLCTVDIWD